MDHDYPHFVTVKWYGVPDSETLSGRRFSDYLRGYMIGDDCVDREDFLRTIRHMTNEELDILLKDHMITKNGTDYIIFDWEKI